MPDQFAVYERAGEVHAVKAGFSWPALFFSGVWALTKQMPGVGAGLLGALIGPLVLGELGILGEVGHQVGHLAPLAVGIIAGALGNSWWRSSLEERGFDHSATLEAESVDVALAEYRSRTALLEDRTGEEPLAEDPR